MVLCSISWHRNACVALVLDDTMYRGPLLEACILPVNGAESSNPFRVIIVRATTKFQRDEHFKKHFVIPYNVQIFCLPRVKPWWDISHEIEFSLTELTLQMANLHLRNCKLSHLKTALFTRWAQLACMSHTLCYHWYPKGRWTPLKVCVCWVKY